MQQNPVERGSENFFQRTPNQILFQGQVRGNGKNTSWICNAAKKRKLEEGGERERERWADTARSLAWYVTTVTGRLAMGISEGRTVRFNIIP
jgi:hypothetical protein